MNSQETPIYMAFFIMAGFVYVATTLGLFWKA